MLEQLQIIAASVGLPTQSVLIGGIAVGAMMLFVGIASILTQKNPAAIRLAKTSAARFQDRRDRGLLKVRATDPKGIMRSFIPSDLAKRTELHRQLARAGYSGAHALRNFTFVRIMLGLVLPGSLLLMIFASRIPGIILPLGLNDRIGGFSSLNIFQALGVLVAAGYFLPTVWLRGRVTERQQKIAEGFPNALDLMQISVEAGLGFDSAMTRVGNELSSISPEISAQFLAVQHQVQAGRPREAALQEMAENTGVEIVRSFANVVRQSMQFGTSMSEALTSYAAEMREYREIRAQEMANKLPVKMSAVLASLMLPALIILTIGPVVIRYMRMMAG